MLEPGTLWSNILPLEEPKREPYADATFLCFICELTHSTRVSFVCSLARKKTDNISKEKKNKDDKRLFNYWR